MKNTQEELKKTEPKNEMGEVAISPNSVGNPAQDGKMVLNLSEDVDLEQSIRTIRLGLDTIINSTGLINQSGPVHECNRSCLLAKNWMGKMLQAIGTTNPYPSSHDHKSPVIEKQAEHADFNFIKEWNDAQVTTQTGRVKFLRETIQEVHNTFRAVVNGKYNAEGKFMPYEASFPMLVLTHLDEAKMWLGWELNRIKNELDYQEACTKGDVGTCPSPILLPLV